MSKLDIDTSNAISFEDTKPPDMSTSGSTTSGSRSSDEAGFDEEANVNTKVTYFVETEPDVAIANTLHQPYFPTLAARATELSHRRVISVIIPLYNEEGFVLERTISSLQAQQKLPSNCVLDVVIITDGMDKMDESMKKYIGSLFALDEVSKSMFPEGMEVGIVEAAPSAPVNKSGTGTIASLSLILKRENWGKANSQMWWLGGHSPACASEFAFSTDCGIVFSDKLLFALIDRLDHNDVLSAVTGFQRVMPSEMQGDGKWELFNDPSGYFLRQLQSFDFETDQNRKGIQDSIGFMEVIPGPCGLYRSDRLGNLSEGMAKKYFECIKEPTEDLVFGNVKLAEDRIPSNLLVFQHSAEVKKAKRASKVAEMDVRDSTSRTLPLNWSSHSIGTTLNGSTATGTNNKASVEKEYWYTGFVHEVFYFEAEKPLDQLVKQRRRWINGTIAAQIWVLNSGWLWNSDHKLHVKLFAITLQVFAILQALIVRLMGPAFMAALTYNTITMIPVVATASVEELIEIVGSGVKFEGYGGGPEGIVAVVVTSFFVMFHAVFLFAHTPRAIQVKDQDGNYTGMWRSDRSSAFRPALFKICIASTALQTVLMIGTFGVLAVRVGWYNIPLVVQIIGLFLVLPYLIALLDGLNARCVRKQWFGSLWVLLCGTPVYILSSLFFTIWLPSYATARVSDLSWGNKDISTQDMNDAEIALQRAQTGRYISFILVGSNIVVSLALITLIHSVDDALMFLSIPLIGVSSIIYAAVIIDNLIRQLRKGLSYVLCAASN